VNSTRPGEFAHGVRTRRTATSKRVEVSGIGEHNSLSRRTLIPRDQFKLHKLTVDIYWEGTLPRPVRDCPWLDDDSHAEEQPSKLPSPMRDCPRPNDDSHVEEEPCELPSLVRNCPWPDDDSHTEEEPSKQTPVCTHPQNYESCQCWYYLTNVYQSIHTSYLISMLLF
jgi:hypothetical protein